MNEKNVKRREQIEPKYKWNINTIYDDEAEWEKDYSETIKKADNYKVFSGKLGVSSEILLNALKEKDEIWLAAERIYVYARMKKDEDNTSDRYQTMSDRCNSLLSKVSASMSFFTPEFLEIPEETLRKFMEENKKLKVYQFMIEDILRKKGHVLSKEEENILAKMSEVTSATNDIFSMFNNADIKFKNVIDEEGDEVELTHGKYSLFMESYERSVRKDAFEKMYIPYKSQINTLATNYSYNTKVDAVSAEIRKYDSSLAAALSGDNISKDVYHNLIDTVNNNLHVLHKYMDIRRKALKVDELHMYDLYVPMVKIPEKKVAYEEGLDIMIESFVPLGDEYIEGVRSGIKNGWIDVYENKGKTSGAYSFGSYDSMPFMMLNYGNKLKDVFTLAHEMGHSMHSYYTRKTQPYVYGGHSIFTAEVASTVNECLLIEHLISKETDNEMKKYLLNMYIEDFRSTLFRQTMFAEFELLTHEAVEKGEVLTSQWLCNEYTKLNKKYFGPAVVLDEQISYEWARIPHFYRAFYVYKYATGYSAAVALSGKILNEGNAASEKYIEFLKSGESDYPIELLKIAGINMGSKEPVNMAMRAFEKLVNEFEDVVL